MRYIRLLLLPFSWLYAGIIQVRNFLYDRKLLKSFQFDIMTISVGNLTLGGTGKSPVIEYLIRLLMYEYKVATLSRGYKRKTKGFHIVSERDNALTAGDEPFQFYLKFKDRISVAVGEDRIYAIPHLLYHLQDLQCILLDDAYQQRQIKTDIQILLNDYHRPFYRDLVFPAGNLREPGKNADRADLIIVTKCPENISEDEMSSITNKINQVLSRKIPVFFSFIRYLEPRPVWDPGLNMKKNIILVTGIATSDPLTEYLRKNYNLTRHFRFPDHHYFNRKEIRKLTDYFGTTEKDDTIILFTEKDISRIMHTPLEDILKPYPVFFQEITYNFVGKGPEFDRLIKKSVGNSVKVN